MLLIGNELKQQDQKDCEKCLTIYQTIFFNCKKKAYQSSKQHHSAEAEAPLPLYLGLKVHTQTR